MNADTSAVPVRVLRRTEVTSHWIDGFEREVLDADANAFLIPYLDGHIFYVPRAGVLALISEALADAVRRRFKGEEIEADWQSEISAFEDAGAFSLPPLSQARHLDAAANWLPTSVTFSTTQKCTLRCKYCYAEGGRLDDLDIPWEIAQAAIDLVVDNAVKTREQPSINFLGEGEATAAWKQFQQCIDYYYLRCEQHNLTPYVALSTNGVYPSRRTSYIARKCTSVTFSLDGLAPSHDLNRVLPNGKGSFELVVANMTALQAEGRAFNIRCTADASCLGSLPNFVEFVGTHLNCKSVHIEPVFDVTGVTSIKGSIIHPRAAEFVQAFRESRRVAAEYDIELYYSAADLGIKDSFCGATDGRNFLVTARGLITSCNEVLQPSDPRADIFQYGSWDSDNRSFAVDHQKISRLGQLHVGHMTKCHTCVAKFNCAGDCYARTAGLHGDPWMAEYTYRCQITRELLKDNLVIALLHAAAGGQKVQRLEHECSLG